MEPNRCPFQINCNSNTNILIVIVIVIVMVAAIVIVTVLSSFMGPFLGSMSVFRRVSCLAGKAERQDARRAEAAADRGFNHRIKQ